MTNEEAKFLLQGYRPNGRDAEDPALAEALARAERDPALRNWFEREQAFDAVIAGKLREVAPPAGLRESILAGTRLSEQPVAEPARRSQAWWRSGWGVMLAAAAAVAMMVTLALNPSADGPVVASLPRAELLLKTSLADYRGAHPATPHADELGTFGAWLEADGNTLATQVMPVDMEELRRLGCRAIEVSGMEMFEICFVRNGEWYHLYIAPRDGFDPDSLHEEPMFHEQGQFVAASWSDKDYVYLVSSTSGKDALQALL
ncbi:hypothetical protein [Actomonas aquatica]|uniref:Anti-sigma factor n=1 Tax=Actomonas aquatica TaxID=2866162 RepID=A0ABZ1C830_9BACT|nr:hypothetical protein [Opitutus sp. WL0086]WRQ87852.1 hypothetical protein K1X11_000425 [Opitutus sp. WL0086]